MEQQRDARERPGKGRPRALASREAQAGKSNGAAGSAPAAGPRPAGPAPAAGSRRGAARRRVRLTAVWAGLAGALAALGAALVVTGVLAQESPPAPPRDLGTIPAPGSLAPASTSRGRPGRGRAAAAPVTAALPRSRPVSLAIPAIGVHASMIDLGLGPGHTLQVPPLTQAGVQEAGWYDLGPAPGQLGPAVIAGHVDSYQGPGVFFRLGALRPGDQIDVTRADGTMAVFRVDAVDEYSKASFPTGQVYGPVSYAGLRVITCGGKFDYQARRYLSNIVIYAALTGSRHHDKPRRSTVRQPRSETASRIYQRARAALLQQETFPRQSGARGFPDGDPGA